jgi:hypothetical protein
MQTGIDFCRTLMLVHEIKVPLHIAKGILNEVCELNNFYQAENDTREIQSKDGDA